MSTLLIGGGLAAHLVASAWEDGLGELQWLRPASPEASGVPGALMHAFPGRSLLPYPENMTAYAASVATLRAWREALGPELVQEHTILRPVAPGSLGRRYRNTYRRGAPDYPPLLEHATWDGPRLRRDLPALSHAFEEAIVYGPSFCVHMPSALEHMRAGRAFRDARVTALEPRGAGWRAQTTQGTLEAERVLLCVGASLPDWFPALPLAVNGGELLVLRPERPEALPMIVSGGGHIAPGRDGTWVAGSSYLRPEDGYDLERSPASWRDDEETIQAVRGLLARLIPCVEDTPVEAIWRQRRAVFLTDRLPLAGPVPGSPGLFVLGALGSKGLLWGPRLAQCLLRDIHGEPGAIPELARANRARGWTLTSGVTSRGA